MVTDDAMSTHHDVCVEIGRRAGDYVLPVRDNPPTLLSDIRNAFDAPAPGLSPRRRQLRAAYINTASHADRGMDDVSVGRSAPRPGRTTIWIGPRWDRFPPATRADDPGKDDHRGRVGITRLTPEQESPAKFLSPSRSHWAVKDRLHGVHDWTLGLGEDANWGPNRQRSADCGGPTQRRPVSATADWRSVKSRVSPT